MSRNWHAVTAEYNALYNGNLALEAGRAELNQNYRDNYWDLLPIERMQIDEEILLPDSVRNQNFGIAEDKAVKAIQRHSMLMAGKEHNPQIDEAYLLLGKSRYFDQRFIPALEAFNYILQKYPASNSIRSAQIWREKTNIRLENYKVALKNLKRITETSKFEDQEYADAHAAMAQAYINLQHPDSALAPLTVAANFSEKNEEKGRYYFILGQLYTILEQPDNASLAFDEVIALHRKSPRIYMINAYVQKARIFDFENEDPQLLKTILTDLEEDRENRPFLDKIYFQIGEYYHQRDSLDTAMAYYNKSLHYPTSSDPFMRSVNYEILANINFDRSNYQMAAKYFDSTLIEMPSNLREYRNIQKKRKNLDDVIQYKNIADRNDSILRLVNMPQEQQLAFYQDYTEGLIEDYRKEIEEGKKQEAIALNTSGPGVPNLATATPPGGSNFYFYNENRQMRGQREFIKKWGNRELTDNWRWNTIGIIANNENTEESLAEFDIANDPRFDPQTYIDQVPKDASIIDSIGRDRNYAYYQLGIIYNENFSEYQLAANTLENLMESDPEERFILPAKYNLFKAYKQLGRNVDMEMMKTDIIKNYPDSQYALFIQNPASLAKGIGMPEARYDETFSLFEEQQYTEVITESKRYIKQFSGEQIVPKFELLKAMAIGRLRGLEEYKKALNEVSLTYPQAEEGQQAARMLSTSLPRLTRLELQPDSLVTNYKLLYPFETSEREEALALKQQIDSAFVDLKYSQLSTSIDIYTDSTLFLSVHGLQDRLRALGLAELLRDNEDYEIGREFFAISTDNYRVIQLKKNLQDYLNSVRNQNSP